MQTFDVSANILNDRLLVSARPKLKATNAGSLAAGPEDKHDAEQIAVVSLGQCVRARFNDMLLLVLLQLVSAGACAVLSLALARPFGRLALSVGLLVTPLAAWRVAGAVPSLRLLALLLAHDALVLAGLGL
jgi:hypothetical protein